MKPHVKTLLARPLLAAAVLFALTACGGGGGSDSPPPPPAVPAVVSLSAAGDSEAGAKLSFSNSAGAITGLTYSWAFGDGGTSTEASPQHTFTKGGDYEVVLTVRNSAGDSRETRLRVSINNRKLVRDRECSGGAAAGWCWMNPLPTGNAALKVLFRSPTEGWRVGLNGEIFKTTDGGSTWLRRASGVTVNLRDIFFVDAQNGWIVGDAGAVLRTRDAGETWTTQRATPDAGSQLSSVLAAQGDRLLVQGDRGLALSTDGGASWLSSWLTYGWQATADGSVWTFENNQLKQSGDGGQTRTTALTLPTVTQGYAEYSLLVVAGQRLVVTRLLDTSSYNSSTGYYEYKRTTSLWISPDAGKTWSAGATLPTETGHGDTLRVRWVSADGKTLIGQKGYQLKRSLDAGLSWSDFSVTAANVNSDLRALDGDSLLLSHYNGGQISIDGGQSWSAVSTPDSQGGSYLNALQVRRLGATGLAAATGNQVYLSTDLGQTWKKVEGLGSSGNYYGISTSFIDAERGWLIDETGTLKRSSDGGRSWVLQRTGFRPGARIQMVDASNGWVIDGDARLYRTKDGGVVWELSSAAGTSLQTMRFETAELGWARRQYYPGELTYTRDGGANWTTNSALSAALDITLARKEAWVAVGSNGMVRISNDEGKTWKDVFSGSLATLKRVKWVDAQTLIVVGTEGTILRSADLGKTWQSVGIRAYTALNDVAFGDANTGWVVGDQGLVLTTRDGGKTWRNQSSGTAHNLTQVQAADVKTAWISGDASTLLATGTGGD